MEDMVKMKEVSDFYHAKRVFISGHTGFKGSWLTCILEQFGSIIEGYALAPEQAGGLFDYLQPALKGKSNINDIRDRDVLRDKIIQFRPDIIFHLAAQPLVRRSYNLPAETFDVNVTGTANLLEAVTQLPNRCAVVVITTDKVYHNKESGVLYKETDQLGGYDPYSASKACCEIVCESFRNSFFNSITYNQHHKSLATARAGNVIGGGDWSKDRLVPDIINAVFNNDELQIRYPDSIRPWQHVLEAIAGYLILGKNLYQHPSVYAKAYNFGPLPEDHLTVREVVEYAIAYLNRGSWKDVSKENQPHEAALLNLDISLALNELGWKPKLNARTAIQWTLEWYNQPSDQKLGYTLKQIEQYFAL